MSVYAFAGEMGSGKSTAAQVLVDMGFRDLKFADPLKNMLRAFYRTYAVEPDVIERKIEGDLKQETCPVLQEDVPAFNMLRAFYETCGEDEVSAETKLLFKHEPCPWLQDKTPNYAAETLTEDWQGMLVGKTKTPRYAMQTLGTEWRNLIGVSLWSDILIKRVESRLFGDDIVCSDYRFPGHEADALEYLRAYTYRIERSFNRPAPTHASETGIATLPVNDVIKNDGTVEELREKVADIVRVNKAIEALNVSE